MYKISDQILGEYIFHKVFIQDKLLPFSQLIELSYTRRRFGLLHVLTPIINNYGFDDVRLKIIADMEKYWNSKDCEKIKMRFAKNFWFYIPSKTLVFLKSEIGRKANDDYNNYRFEIYKQNHIKSFEDHILETLVNFKRLPEKFSQAQELLLTYGLKSNELFSKYLKALTQSFTFDNENEHTDYDVQAKVLDFLFSKVPLDPVFYSRIILFITPEYLKSSYQTFRTVDSRFYITDRGVYLTAAHKALRTKLLGFVFERFSNKSLKFYVYDCLQAYMNKISSFHTYAKAIIFDRTQLMHFFRDHFSPKEYTDCFLVYLYGERLKYAGIRFDKRFSSKFMAPRYLLYLKLNEEYHKLKDYRGDFDNYEKYKYAELGLLIKNYTFSDYLKLFSDIQFILTEGKRFVRDAPIKDSISYILDILAQKDPKLFYRCLKNIFSFGFAKELELYRMFMRFKFTDASSERIRDILAKCPVGKNYLINFWFSLPPDLFTKRDITLLKRHIADGSFSYTGNLDAILPKAAGLYKDYSVEIGKIIDLLTERSEGIQKVSTHAPFFQYIESNYNELFRQRLARLQSLYFYFDQSQFYTKRQIRDSYLHKLWKTDSDTDFLFRAILEHFKGHIPISNSYSSEVTVVFKGGSKRELDFLRNSMSETNDKALITLIFNIVLSMYKEYKLEFVDLLLKKPNDFSLFTNVPLHVQSSLIMAGGSESGIARIKNNIRDIESYKVHLKNKDGVDFLEHIEHLEGKVHF